MSLSSSRFFLSLNPLTTCLGAPKHLPILSSLVYRCRYSTASYDHHPLTLEKLSDSTRGRHPHASTSGLSSILRAPVFNRSVPKHRPGQTGTRSFGTSTRDYYHVLGVSRSASQDEIKKAYRRLALQWHPDRNQGDKQKESERRFREIAEAHEVIGDPQKRKQYDMFGEAEAQHRPDGPTAPDFGSFAQHHMSNAEAHEMFRRMFQDLFRGAGAQGSPFSGYNIDDLLKNLGQSAGASGGTTQQQQFTTIINRNGRMIQRTVTTTRMPNGRLEERVQEIDMGPASAMPGGFTPFQQPGRAPMRDVFTILETFLRTGEQPGAQQGTDFEPRFPRDFQKPRPPSKQLQPSSNPVVRFIRMAKEAWHTQTAREMRFLLKMKFYDTAFRVLTRVIERAIRFLIRQLTRR